MFARSRSHISRTRISASSLETESSFISRYFQDISQYVHQELRYTPNLLVHGERFYPVDQVPRLLMLHVFGPAFCEPYHRKSFNSAGFVAGIYKNTSVIF